MAPRRRYLVAYDIRQPKRLRAVHRLLKANGYPVQYSVFVCDLTKSEKIAFRWEVGEVVDHGIDSVVLVDLGEAGQAADRFECIGVPVRTTAEGGEARIV
ncbi:MAG: CRISPR-associated endonuclease Cas2 [Acidimicrobiales bacterium]